MKNLLISSVLALAFIGCGHTTTIKDTTPAMAHSSTTDNGVFSTEVTQDTQEKSAYTLCLEKNAGYPGAAEECGYWIRAGRPGQLPLYQYGYGWNPSYSGYVSRSGWVSPGY